MAQSSNSKDNGKNDNNDLLTSSAEGAYYLVLLQFASRMLTFALHQIVLRYTTAEVLGIASVKLELLLSTILFISREGFRCALLRGEGDVQSSKQAQQKVTNLAYIPMLLGLGTTLLACGYYLYQIDEATAAKYPFYRTSVVLFGAAAFAELLVEPLFVLAMNRLYFQLRVSVEGVAVVLRTFITFGLTLWGASTGSNAFGVLAFAVAQFAFGVTMVLGYLGFFLKKVRRSEMDVRELYLRKLRRSDDTSYWFDRDMLNLATTLTKQSLLKHVLTEGDKMLISALTTDENQGVYAFVVNYGSLVVRILFQPLEETSRTFFSKILADASKQADTNTAARVLLMLLQFHVLLGLLFVCFATNYTGTLIDLLVGKEWSVERNGPAVLAVYCTYVPVMGINGITEAFVQAVASKSDLQTLSYYMVVFSACFMASGYVFMSMLDLGATGLILANIVNLSIRIAYSWSYIAKYFEKSTAKGQLVVRNWFPHLPTLLAFAVSWLVTRYSEQTIGWQTIDQKMLHISVGALCFLVTAGVTAWQEKAWINDMRRMAKANKSE